MFTEEYANLFDYDDEIEAEFIGRCVICRWEDEDGLRREEIVFRKGVYSKRVVRCIPEGTFPMDLPPITSRRPGEFVDPAMFKPTPGPYKPQKGYR